MTPAGPDVKAIFSEALRIAAGAARAAYLDRACGGEARLRLRVEALLAAHERADDVLGRAGATSVAELATIGPDPGAAEAIGPTNPGPNMGRPDGDSTGPATTRGSDRDAETSVRGNRVRYFGDYEIRRELGRGGMGVVYEARQVSLNRPVALKMVRAGLLAGDDELRRFQNEAEAVALLDHPGIVPIYEVGAHDSQHFFSMKLVPGGSLVPLLTRYRDDPRAAARLAAEAAEAVAHAHARGILHRDLKPANILVDDQGRPHVTDFGLAKKVEADVELTQSGAILGTPAYMSPEQASGRRGAVTTASDVYGLGAVLYSLLTGRAPFGGDSVGETIDAVRHRPPEPPRQLNAALPRDLETICLRCLEKDPRRRYPTAQALADDLQAWLDSRPIAARRVGPAERAWLWCRRRPAVAALSAAVALAVVVGAAATIAVQYAANRRLDAKNLDLDRANAGLREAIDAKDRANAALAEANVRVQARFDLAREAIRSLKQGVEDEETLKEDRLRPLRDKLLGSARRFYDRLGALLEDQTDDASKAVLAESYAELGKLIDEIGQKPEALEAYRKAVAIRRELAAAPSAVALARVELARSLNAFGAAAYELGDHAAALAAYEEARSLAEPPASGQVATIEARRALGLAFFGTGTALDATGADGQAMVALRRSRAVRESLAREAAALPDDRFDLADTIVLIGGLLNKTGDLAGALAEQRTAQELLGALVAKHPDVPRYRNDLAGTHNWVGALLEQTGDLAGALAEQRKAQELWRALTVERPAVPVYRRELANGHARVGILLEAAGDLTGALAELRTFQELMLALAAEHPDAPRYRRELLASHNRVGVLLDKTGDVAGALDQYRRCLELTQALAAEYPDVIQYRSDLAISYNKVGDMLQKTGDLAGALTEYRSGQRLVRALAAEYPTVPQYRSDLAISHNRVGGSLENSGDLVGAIAERRRFQDLVRALVAEYPAIPRYRSDLARSHIGVGGLLALAGRPAEALDELERARSLFEALAQAGPNVPGHRDNLAAALTRGGDVLRDLGRADEARACLGRAVALAEALTSAQPTATAYRDRLADALRRLAWLKLEAGDAAGAVADAHRAIELFEGLPSRDGQQWFGSACARATLSAAAGHDRPGLSAGEAPGLAGRAMDDLRRAAAMGWRNPAIYRYEPALGPLRARKDFRDLMHDLNFPADPFARGE